MNHPHDLTDEHFHADPRLRPYIDRPRDYRSIRNAGMGKKEIPLRHSQQILTSGYYHAIARGQLLRADIKGALSNSRQRRTGVDKG